MKQEPQLWYTDIKNIKLTGKLEFNQPDPLRETILNDIPIKNLLDKLTCGNGKAIPKGGLYKLNFQDIKTDKIFNHWRDGQRLIPPPVSYIHNQGLVLTDGRHRVNAAFHFNQTHISISVPLNEECLVKEILEGR